MDKSAFGRLLRETRQRSLMTLEGLAEASGVSVRAISDMERGQSVPRQATLRELLDALGLDEEQGRRLVQASAAVRRAKQVPQQLPPDIATFRSRDEALATAEALTSQITAGDGPSGGHVVVSAIGGMAGVGKTAFAVHWAHRVADRFPDGQLYVNLRGFEATELPLEPGEVLGGFLGALGVAPGDIPASTEERGALFRQRTAQRRLIVLLDNARNTEQVRPLLPMSARCLTIVTSRNRLSGLAAAEGASLIGLDTWTPAEALAALAARVGDDRCRAEPVAAAELVELCGRLPLAVAVVGAQIGADPDLPLHRSVHELRKSRSRLDGLSGDDERVGVRAVFSWSYQALAPDTARFFRHLAVHPGTALSAEAAASLVGVGMPAARRRLRELTAASLLSRDAEGRYVLHDLVRAYGSELLDQRQDDRFGAETRLLRYLCDNAHAANRLLDTRPALPPDDAPEPGAVGVAIDDRSGALEWFRQEEPAFAAVLHSVNDPRLLRHLVRLTHHWQSYLAVVGRWSEQIPAQRAGMAHARTLDDPVAIARIGIVLASALGQTGQADAADEHIALILAQLPRLPPAEQATTERSVAGVFARREKYTEALRHTHRALDLFRALGDHDGIARELNAVGWFGAMLGDYEDAVAMCRQALPMLQAAGNRRDEAATWDSIAYARQHLGDIEGAIEDYHTSLRLYGEITDPFNQADVLDHLASAHLQRGDVEEARSNWNRAADLLTGIGHPHAAAMRSKAATADTPHPHSPPVANQTT
ncbi:tetratricopeptide repeat protein [Streptomyces sp. cg28]|uniref:tetratricopeptide repeat protein n=1 Tax=Streptomyces sp. cg28 TaxID=3403457 RepID=UPI003B20DE8A